MVRARRVREAAAVAGAEEGRRRRAAAAAARRATAARRKMALAHRLRKGIPEMHRGSKESPRNCSALRAP